MRPCIRKNDIVIIKRIPAEEITRGDIICFSRDSEFVIHRLVSIENGSLITKGDRLPNFDIPFSMDKVIGVVVAIERDNQTISLQTPPRNFYARIMVIMNLISDTVLSLYHMINQRRFKG